jgi:hypothetical protein
LSSARPGFFGFQGASDTDGFRKDRLGRNNPRKEVPR